MDITLETILRPAFLPPERISDATYAANLAAATAKPHVATAFRSLYAKAERALTGGSTDPNDVNGSQLFMLAASMGEMMWSNFTDFQPPKKVSVAKEDTIPTWVEAAREALADVAGAAIIAGAADVFAKIKDGTIKSTGLPEDFDLNRSGEDLFFEVIRGHGQPYTMFQYRDLKYPGCADHLKGKECSISFGWYSNSWRPAPKPKADKADKAATPAATAPVPEAK